MTENSTKTVRLTFSRDALLYDIGNYAYIQGDAMPTADAQAKQKIIDLTQEGNIDRVTRILDLAHTACVEVLFPYTKIACDIEETRSNELVEGAEYVVTMSVPHSFSKTTIDLIAKLIHEYMVYYVMADWLSLTYPAMSTVWTEKLSTVAKEIRTRLNARCGRVRRTQSPF